jgi:hypothetical protein
MSAAAATACAAEEDAMKAICVLAILVSLPTAPKPDPGRPEFEFSNFEKPKDTGKAYIEEGKAVIRITSSTGIGGVSVKAKKGQWPRDVTIVIEGITNLEQFAVTTDRLWAEGSLKESGHAELSLRNAKGELEKSSPDGHLIRAGWLDIRVEKRKEGMAIIFPANLCADTKSIRIGWIDAWRR